MEVGPYDSLTVAMVDSAEVRYVGSLDTGGLSRVQDLDAAHCKYRG